MIMPEIKLVLTRKDVPEICAKYTSEETTKLIRARCDVFVLEEKLRLAREAYDEAEAILLQVANEEGWEV